MSKIDLPLSLLLLLLSLSLFYTTPLIAQEETNDVEALKEDLLKNLGKKQLLARPIKKLKTDGSLQKYYEHMRQTVVGITARKSDDPREPGYYGTGTVIGTEGYILTSTTVVPDETFKNIVVLLPGFKQRKAKVVYADEKYEISVIQITGDVDAMNYASFASSNDVEIGDRVFTAGNPFHAIEQNDDAVLSAGIVSSKYIAHSTTYKEGNSPALKVYTGKMIEITAASNGGGDGGGIYDDRGQIIGILSLNSEKIRSLGLCVPIDIVKEQLLKALKDKTEHQGLINEIRQKPSTKSLLKAEPIRQILQLQARKVFPGLTALEVKRDNKNQGGDKARNPYGAGQPATTKGWSIPKGFCSGIYVDASGLILTSYFNISGDVKSIHAVDQNGKKIKCEVLGYDQGKDLALLKTDQNVDHFINFDATINATLGQSIAYVGRACNGNQMSLTMGTISATGRWFGTACQTDAKCNMGISGSLLIDIYGKPCGIANHIDGKTSWNVNSGVSFATTGKHILTSLTEMKAGKKITIGERGFLGVQLITESEGRGLAIDPEKGKAAAVAGIKKGDRIIEVEGQAINNTNDLLGVIFSKNVGDKVSLKILRGKEELSFTLTLLTQAGKTKSEKLKKKKNPEKKEKNKKQSNKEKSDTEKMIDQAVEQARKQLEENGTTGKQLEEMLKKVRKQVKEQIEKQQKKGANGSSSFPIPKQKGLSPAFIQKEIKKDKEKKKEPSTPLLESALKSVEKDLRGQGFQGEELKKLLQDARINLTKQIKDKNLKAPKKKLSKEEMIKLHKQAMAQIKKDFENQGFFGKTLKKMLEKTSEKMKKQIKGDPYAIDDRAYLGITLKELVEGEGVSITPLKGKAADRAGIKDGDRIIKFNDRVINSPNDLVEEIQSRVPGDIVQIKVKRQGHSRYFSFPLDGANGPVKSTEAQLKSKFNKSPINHMVENALPQVKNQLKNLKLPKEKFEKMLDKVENQIREEISKRMEAK